MFDGISWDRRIDFLNQKNNMSLVGIIPVRQRNVLSLLQFHLDLLELRGINVNLRRGESNLLDELKIGLVAKFARQPKERLLKIVVALG